MLQLDLFRDPPTELELLHEEMKQTKESTEKVRKGMFGRHNELMKMFLEQKEDLDLLKRFQN